MFASGRMPVGKLSVKKEYRQAAEISYPALTLTKFSVDTEHWPRDANQSRYHMRAKGHFVAPYDPAHEDGSKRVQTHKRRIDRPFGFYKAAIEDQKTRNAL